MEFGYAHKNTCGGERQTPTAQFNGVRFCGGLEEIIKSANEREIPVSCRETLAFLTALAAAVNPVRILEIGTAVGVSALAMLSVCPSAHITTIEKDPAFHAEAVENFRAAGKTQHVSAILGDAAEILPSLGGEYGLIFLDGAKAQYIKYLPHLKRLLKKGGTLLADDVLLFGYVSGESETPKKRKSLVGHVREYINAVTGDPELRTVVVGVGDGMAMSVKI